jgi:hypothetical protein
MLARNHRSYSSSRLGLRLDVSMEHVKVDNLRVKLTFDESSELVLNASQW